MAKEFNKISPTDETNKISFLDVGLVEVQGNGNGKKVFYNVEDLLFDYKLKFTKWCNNTGTHDMVKSHLFLMFICHIFSCWFKLQMFIYWGLEQTRTQPD